jgi:hypothetical protein
MRTALILCFTLLSGAAWAQPGMDSRSARKPVQVFQPARPVTKATTITPKVGTTVVQPDIRRPPTADIATESKNIRDTIRRPDLAQDTRIADPRVRFDPAQDGRIADPRVRVDPDADVLVRQPPVSAGNDFAEPRTGAGAEAVRQDPVAANSPAAAKLAVRQQVDQTARVRNDANRLTEKSFALPADLHAHRQAVSTIERAARTLETRAVALPPSDLAVAQYHIDYATRQAAGVNRAATGGQLVSNEQVRAVQNAATPVQSMTSRIMSGQRPFPARKVSVRVGSKDGREEIGGLQVYVLPGGVLDNPGLFSESEIRSYLTRFSFTQLTSPAEQEVAVFDMRLWIGPRMNFDPMIQLVADNQLKKFRVINDPTVADRIVQLTFTAPDDLIEP